MRRYRLGSDDLFKKRKSSRQKRSSKQLITRPVKWLFVCEGSKSEPIYIKRLIEYYKNKSNKNLVYKVEGTGKNTESLVNSVDSYLETVNELKRRSNIPYVKIFTAFDKDSFSKNKFNNAIFKSNKNGYITLWSNECFELWFILHYQYLDSDTGRKMYYEKLSSKFNCNYEDNKAEDYFDLLDSDNNLIVAYSNAIKLYDYFLNEKSFAKKCPCTMMFKLIDELNAYFEVNLV